MKTFIFLLSLALMSNAHPQGYGNVVDVAPAEEDLTLIDDVFGGGKTTDGGFGGGAGEINIGPIEPEPNYGDGGSHVNEVVDTSYEDCAYYADQDYKCVPYYNCEDGEIVTDGGGLIDIRSSFSAVLDPASSKCPGYLEVCCRHPDFSTNAPVTTTPKPVTEPPKPRTYQPECGRRNFGGVGVRIQNDKYKGSTQFGEWPHMCALLEVQPVAYGEEINKYVCGASLIAPGVVLTGAHCVAKIPAENIKIRCGEWDTQKQIEPSEHQDRFVENVKIHPLFDPRNLQNDFALLFLEEDFKLAPHVDTICLPDNLAGIHSYEHKDCFATGWGKDKFGKLGEYQVIMKQVQMDTVNSTECERRLRRTRLGGDFELHKSFICAGGEKDRDTCKGDGGGPLVCPLHRELGDGYSTPPPPKYVQAGIIAWGIDCGVEGNPGVYANVADGLCFIDWATHCETGIPKYFNISGCQNWAPEQIDSLKYKIHSLKERLAVISSDGSGTKSNIRNLHRKITIAEKRLAAFEQDQSICIASSGYGEINNNNDNLVDGFGRNDNNAGGIGGSGVIGGGHGGSGVIGGGHGGSGIIGGGHSGSGVIGGGHGGSGVIGGGQGGSGVIGGGHGGSGVIGGGHGGSGVIGGGHGGSGVIGGGHGGSGVIGGGHGGSGVSGSNGSHEDDSSEEEIYGTDTDHDHYPEPIVSAPSGY